MVSAEIPHSNQIRSIDNASFRRTENHEKSAIFGGSQRPFADGLCKIYRLSRAGRVTRESYKDTRKLDGGQGVNRTLDTRIFSTITYLDKKCSVVHYWRNIKGFWAPRGTANGQHWLFEHLQTVTKELQDKGLLILVSWLSM